MSSGELSQVFAAIGHLGLKRHPLGGAIRLGGKPSMVANLPPLFLSILGTERSNPIVYGWDGLPKISGAPPFSTILAAYITLTLSAYAATTPKLWVIMMMATPSLLQISFNNSSICA